jgi:hypothetical protein
LVSRDVLQIRQFDVRAWLAPGVAGAIALLPGVRKLPVVTKAGTWGDVQVLVRGIEWIMAQCGCPPPAPVTGKRQMEERDEY